MRISKKGLLLFAAIALVLMLGVVGSTQLKQEESIKNVADAPKAVNRFEPRYSGFSALINEGGTTSESLAAIQIAVAGFTIDQDIYTEDIELVPGTVKRISPSNLQFQIDIRGIMYDVDARINNNETVHVTISSNGRVLYESGDVGLDDD